MRQISLGGVNHAYSPLVGKSCQKELLACLNYGTLVQNRSTGCLKSCCRLICVDVSKEARDEGILGLASVKTGSNLRYGGMLMFSDNANQNPIMFMARYGCFSVMS